MRLADRNRSRRRGAILSRGKSRTSTYEADPKAFGKLVADEIYALLTRARVSPRKVARVGIAVQGVADSQAGTVVWSPAFRGRNISVAATMVSPDGVTSSPP